MQVSDGMELLGGLCAQLDEQLQTLAPNLNFAAVFWNQGAQENPLGVALFARPDLQPEAPYAAVTVANATWSAGSGLELHGLDTPERVCFYEQDFYVLSNFSAFSLRWKGWTFPTVEHAYHWEKFVVSMETDSSTPGIPNTQAIESRLTAADAIRCTISAHEAFTLAQGLKQYRRPDWDQVKVGVMQLLLFAKCEQHEYVKRKLLATGDRLLVENSWRDDFWGWGPNRDGQNMLGRLWMATRAHYRRLETASSHNDGWTDQKCPTCRGSQFVRGPDGEDRACGACGGTGEEYRADLDKRGQP